MNKDPELVYSFFDEYPEEIINCISLVKIINVNYECLKLHKVKSKEELITNLNKLIDVSAIDTIKRQLVAIAQNAKQFNIDSRIKNNYGEYRDIHLRWSVIKGHEETYERVILSTEDVTERKATEKIIVDSQEKIESIINTIDGIVWEYDFESEKVTFVSKKIVDILGYTIKEYTEMPFFWESKIHPEDQNWVIAFSSSSDKKKQSRVIEYRMITKNGETIWIRDIVNVVLRNKEMTGLRGIMIDITNMKEAEEDLNNSLYLVKEQNKRLLNFSYIVSHNLRSHTSNIKSIVSLVETEETEEERHEMMKLLKSVSNSLDETMDHLNDVINVNTNINLVTKPLVLHQYIETVKAVLTEQIQLTQATITSDIPEDLMVNYNPAYLESILHNLISNAIRYRHPDREPIISLKWRKEDNQNVLEITDNGIGIDLVKNGDKIFGMYKTFSSNVDSKGIGLFITRNQIEAMGGSITVTSEPCVGTTFKIYIK
jgi:PAS domain S-box-containing protein